MSHWASYDARPDPAVQGSLPGAGAHAHAHAPHAHAHAQAQAHAGASSGAPRSLQASPVRALVGRLRGSGSGSGGQRAGAGSAETQQQQQHPPYQPQPQLHPQPSPRASTSARSSSSASASGGRAPAAPSSAPAGAGAHGTLEMAPLSASTADADADAEKAGRRASDGATSAAASAAGAGAGDVEKQQSQGAGAAPAPGPAAPPAMTFPDGGLAAWSVVLGGALVFTAGVGYINSFSVFQSYYVRVTLAGHSEKAVAWIGSLQLWGAFGFGIPAGLLLDRYGPKVPLLLSTFFIVLGSMMASISTKYWHFLLSQGLCSAFGFGLSFTPALAAPQQWFLKQRALATGLVVSGTSLGGVLWPIAINRLLNYDGVSLGWTLRAVAFLQLGLMLAASALVQTRVPRRMSKGLPLALFFRHGSMVVITCGLLVLFFALYVPYFYITPYGMRWGASAQAAFYYPAIMNGVSFFGRFFCGIVADRYLGYFNTMIVTIIITGVLSFCWIPVHDNAGNIVWSCFYGFFSGALQSLFTPVAAKLAPAPHLISAWVGIAVTIIAFGLLGSQPVAGKLLDDHADVDFAPMQAYVGAMTLASAVPVIVSRFMYNRKDLIV